MNNNLTTLGQVCDDVSTLSKRCYDELVPVDDISFHSLDMVQMGSAEHPVRPIAQRSFCHRLGIPFNYIRKCPQELQQKNLNFWIEKERNEQLFVRFDGDEVRALFTHKYTPIDNFEVLERLDALGYQPDTKVQCHLDGEFMSLNIPDSKKSFRVNGDAITPGLSISNSEVGLSSLHIAAFFLRLVCTNGLIAKTEIGASYRHVSLKILNEFPEVLERVSRGLLTKMDQFKLSVESHVADPEDTIKVFNKQFMLNEHEQKAVEWGYTMESGNTMFNIVNAYTRAAQYQGLHSAESKYRVQTVAGNILSIVKTNGSSSQAHSTIEPTPSTIGADV